jgi:hypothetical protein
MSNMIQLLRICLGLTCNSIGRRATGGRRAGDVRCLRASGGVKLGVQRRRMIQRLTIVGGSNDKDKHYVITPQMKAGSGMAELSRAFRRDFSSWLGVYRLGRRFPSNARYRGAPANKRPHFPHHVTHSSPPHRVMLHSHDEGPCIKRH